MLKTDDNPGGVPIEVFDGIRAGSLADRSQLYRDLADGPFFGNNREGVSISQGIRDAFWRQGLQAGHKNAYDSIAAFSATDMRDDLRAVDVPTLVIHGDDDQVVPFAVGGQASAALVAGARLKVYPGAPHGITDTHKDELSTDLLAFARGDEVGEPGAVGCRGEHERTRWPDGPPPEGCPRAPVGCARADADRPRTRARPHRPAPRRAVRADPARTARGRRQRAGRGRGRPAAERGMRVLRARGVAGRVRLPVRRPRSAPAPPGAPDRRGHTRPRGCGGARRRGVRVRRRSGSGWMRRPARRSHGSACPRSSRATPPARTPWRSCGSGRWAPRPRSCCRTTFPCSCASGSCARPPATRSR